MRRLREEVGVFVVLSSSQLSERLVSRLQLSERGKSVQRASSALSLISVEREL